METLIFILGFGFQWIQWMGHVHVYIKSSCEIDAHKQVEPKQQYIQAIGC